MLCGASLDVFIFPLVFGYEASFLAFGCAEMCLFLESGCM